MQRCLLDVRQVHGNLRDSVLFDVPTNGLHVLQHSRNADGLTAGIQHRFSKRRPVFRFDPSVFSHIKRDRICSSHRFRVQVHIIRDQKIACTDHSCARFLIENGRPKLRFPCGAFYFLKKAFVFSRANDREIRARRVFCRSFVKIDGDAQLLADAFSQLVCASDRFFPTDVAHWNERANVGGAHARMRALMFAHVDQFGRLFDSAKGRFHRGIRTAHKRHHRPVRTRARIDIE